MDFFVDRALFLVPLWLSLTVHEWAHAAAADACGDDTARLLGRKSLDPFVHVDPVGTFLLPLLGVPFGWANPVPINPNRFRRVSMAAGLWLTAAAGPASNVALALAAALGYRALAAAHALSVPGVEWLLTTLVPLNLALAAFNLLPIPPLDGSRVVDAWIPYGWRRGWMALGPLGPAVIIGAGIGLEVAGIGPFTALRALASALIGR